MKLYVVLSLVMAPFCVAIGDIELGQCRLALTCDQDQSASSQSNQAVPTERLGPPGKSGPAGPPGPPGTPGKRGPPCACVDVEGELQSLNEKLSQMTEKWQSSDEQLKNVTKQLHDVNPLLPIKDCSEFKSIEDGISFIYDKSLKFARAMCDMTTTPGGWTVIQRRFDGSVDFFRNWEQYKVGFGDPTGEYWLGLESLYKLTNQTEFTLRVDIEDEEGNVGHATYNTFRIGSEKTNYQLTVSGYDGNIGNSLSSHNGKMFTTKDRDHDTHGKNCAELGHGAWWYAACAASNLNGKYGGGSAYWSGVGWSGWKGWITLKSSKLMIRPRL